MIDEEAEQAVERWVRLGDEASGRRQPVGEATCKHCGSTRHVLDRGHNALCVRCYLESGAAGPEPVAAEGA